MEICCQSHPDTAEKGGHFTLSQQPGFAYPGVSEMLKAQVWGEHITPCLTQSHPPLILHSSSYNSNNFPFIGLYTQVMTTWSTEHLRGCFRPFAPGSQSLSDGQNLPPCHRCIILLARMMRFGPRKYLWAPPRPLICSPKELVRIVAAEQFHRLQINLPNLSLSFVTIGLKRII